MNGRLYDPALGRFFSPDPFVVDATFTQDFNRYSYARNNPLMYTDPSGEFPWLAIGIASAIYAYLGGTAANNNPNPIQWKFGSGYTWAGIGIGAVAGGLAGWGFAAAAPSLLTAKVAGFKVVGLLPIAGGVLGGAAGYATGYTATLLATNGNWEDARKAGTYYGAIGSVIGSVIGTTTLLSENMQNFLQYGRPEVHNFAFKYATHEYTIPNSCAPSSFADINLGLGGDPALDVNYFHNEILSNYGRTMMNTDYKSYLATSNIFEVVRYYSNNQAEFVQNPPSNSMGVLGMFQNFEGTNTGHTMAMYKLKTWGKNNEAFKMYFHNHNQGKFTINQTNTKVFDELFIWSLQLKK